MFVFVLLNDVVGLDYDSVVRINLKKVVRHARREAFLHVLLSKVVVAIFPNQVEFVKAVAEYTLVETTM